jgi:hypothetical protein
VAADILEGRYEFPENFDQATRELCEECALIRKIIPKNSVKIKMSKEDYVAHWKRAKEETGIRPALWALHGRNRVRVHLPLSRPQSMVLDRWAQGLSVMLQKLFGCSLITKLRAILLMEANLNCSTKTVFGIRMLDEARRQNLMPEEVFSKRNKMADDGTLTKVLTYDIIRQTR